MAPLHALPSTKVFVYYLQGFGKASLALLPVECAAFNQSPVSFLVYRSNPHGAPRLLEVLYEGNVSSQLLTERVRTAAQASFKPHGWSGFFEWNGPESRFPWDRHSLSVGVHGNTLSLGGLVIPVGGTPPSHADSETGLVEAIYTFVWRSGIFEFEGASAGVAPVVPKSGG